VRALKELKMYISLSADNKVLLAVPVTKAIGTVAETKIMIARLLTQDEINRETAEAMQQGCRQYERKNRRVRQKK
jgi:hypothetical protein